MSKQLAVAVAVGATRVMVVVAVAVQGDTAQNTLRSSLQSAILMPSAQAGLAALPEVGVDLRVVTQLLQSVVQLLHPVVEVGGHLNPVAAEEGLALMVI